MKEILIKENIIPTIEELHSLYKDAGWSNYTNDLDKLSLAFYNSLKVLSAWDKDQLVGIIRAVGDGYTIVYIQDILVLNHYKRRGIGESLMNQLLSLYKNVRQKVLMTDNQPDTIAFYTKCGFVPTETYNGISFVKYN